MVFDPAAAPRERDAFKAWYSKQTEWSEAHGYADPTVTTPALRNWYEQIIEFYPNMNGDRELEDHEYDVAADYSIGSAVIYGAFAWSTAEDVYTKVRELAVECEVGFYDVSGDEGDGEIYFPGDAVREPSQGTWRQISADFKSGNVSHYVAQANSEDQPLETKRSWFDIFRRK